VEGEEEEEPPRQWEGEEGTSLAEYRFIDFFILVKNAEGNKKTAKMKKNSFKLILFLCHMVCKVRCIPRLSL